MGKFQVGQNKPKSSGRKKGAPNKKTLLLNEALQNLGLNVPVRLVELLPSLKAEKQADVLLALMTYLYPKRKALEISASGDSVGLEESRGTLRRIIADPESYAALELVEKRIKVINGDTSV